MKTIKTLLLVGITPFLLSALTSCTDYQDEIDGLDGRVTYLESLVKELQSNIDALSAIVKAMNDGDFITDVKPTLDGRGYTINFKKYGIVTIIDGKDGEDGKDAAAPNIGVRQDPLTGDWCWTLNGDWLLVNGSKIRANGKDGADGKDGQDGQDGKDGKDAVSPQVRINPTTGMWEVSPDGGLTWISTGTKATGNNGSDGKDGKDGNQFFEKVTYEVTSEGEFMVVITKSGQTFRIPIYRPTTTTT
jgi:hypothetical protein